MKESMDDAERIAKLLDGRLDARQRAEVLARLSESEAALDALVDAAAVVGEGTADSKVMTMRRWRLPATVLAAAAIVAAILIPIVRFAKRPRSDNPERFAALLISRAPLPADWNGAPWSVSRGGGETLTDSVRAVRLGARLTDLAMASRSGDTSASRTALDIVVLLDALPGSASVAQIYRQIADPSRDPLQRDSLQALGAPLAAALAGRPEVDLGAWTEAARIAARRHDATFFESADSRSIVPRLPASLSLTLHAPFDWNALPSQLEALLVTLAE